MTKLSLGILLMILLAGCSSTQRVAGSGDGAYRKLADDYLNSYLAWRPQAGTRLGLHEYDGKISDFGAASIEKEHSRLRQFRDELAALDQGKLSAPMSRESRALLAAVESELFAFEVARGHTQNPMTYAGLIDLVTYAQRDFAPKPKRLASVVAILRQTPAIFAAGRANLQERLPRTFIEVAIQQAEGMAEFVEKDLVKAFADVSDETLQRDFAQASKLAVDELKGFSQWLKREKLPRASDDFAIGPAGFERFMKQCELIDRSPRELLAIGTSELRREQQQFAAAAKRIDPGKPAREVAAAMAKEHPTEQTLIPEARKRLDDIRQFVIEKDLVGFPSMVPVRVEETPKFERNQSFASMDSPGPLDTATQAFYFVTPTEAEWDAKKKEEWLSFFNFYTTDMTSIHEAYPGHYLQFLRLRASGVSRVAMAFYSYCFVEGWAHYCEQMVIDEGYPLTADATTRAKYRLAQSQDALLRLCRLCCSVKMHCEGMSVDEATRFFMDNAYMAESPARQEAVRGTWDPGYGCYTLGKLQILKLRQDWRAQEGDAFSLRRFHEMILDQGQPPIRLLRELLVKDRSKWDQTL